MKTIREEKVGKATVRLLEMKGGYAGVVIAAGTTTAPLRNDDPDELWRELLAQVRQSSPSYFGYDGARKRFLGMFPDGFAGQPFVAEERAYKRAAADLLDKCLPLARAADATEADCREVVKVYNKTNLLSLFEAAKLRDLLHGKEGPGFVRSAAAFAAGDVSEGLKGMERALMTQGQASWPTATYLPFLWAPERHMFLKPMVTREFAERVGHDFAHAYSASFHPDVYAALLDLARETREHLTDLEPRDNIDIQSFVWIVGAYTEKDAEALKAKAEPA